MKTYSHLLITAALHNGLESGRVQRKAFLLGSIMPDLPLLGLTLGFVAKRWWAGLSPADDPICGPHFNHLYFHHPVWQASHNLLHAPLLIGLMAWLGYRWVKGEEVLVWFAAGCGLHTLIDIFTHHDDGPLLFFPFNWRYRFAAPVSYWDARRGGKNFAVFERLLALALGIYLAASWILDRKF